MAQVKNTSITKIF